MDAIRQLISHPLFNQVQDLLMDGDIVINKELLLIARHMGLAEGFGNFRDLTRNATDKLLNLPYFTSGRGLRAHSSYIIDDPSLKLQSFFSNPLYSGAIIMSCFLAPLSLEQEQQMFLDAAMKEINVMDSDAYFEDLDFSPFFGQYDEALAPTVAPNPKMAQKVHSAIDAWIQNQRTTSLFPSMSKKLLPGYTRRELDQYVSLLLEEPHVATPGSIELLDVVEQIRFDGPCEMAQRWYTNQNKPRTYFVSGATAHHRSKFLKKFWNSLCDELSVSNRFNRVNPSRLHYDGVKQGVFYDLTSFTSNMAVQRRFLDMLGAYCTGHQVTVVDGRYGHRSVDMGELILEYNSMNWMPEYTTDLFSPYNRDVYHHGVGGFLGVYGNIATCTFLHAAFLLQLVTIEEECSCAGDDAVAFVEDEHTIWGCVPLIGILAPEKGFLLSDIDVVYLKRRTWLDYRSFQLRQKSYLQLPSFLTKLDFRHYTRFKEKSYSREQLFEIAASSLGATFRSMARIFSQQSAFDDGVHFMEKYYEMMNFPFEGNVPQFTNNVRGPKSKLIPALDTLGSHDYIAQTIQSLYPGKVRLPLREDYGDRTLILTSGVQFTSGSTDQLVYLRRLGFIEEVRAVHETFFGEEGLSRLLEEFDRNVRLPPAKTIYRVVRTIPSYMFGGNLEVTGEYDVDFSYMYDTSVISVDHSGDMDSVLCGEDEDIDSDYDFDI